MWFVEVHHEFATFSQSPQSTEVTLSSLYDECMASTDLQQMRDKTTTLHTRYQSEVY